MLTEGAEMTLSGRLFQWLMIRYEKLLILSRVDLGLSIFLECPRVMVLER